MPTFVDALLRASQVAGNRTAVISEGHRYTHADIRSKCCRLASALKNKGVQPGDRVAILAANSVQYIECYLAIPAAGFIVVPLNTRHAEPELVYAVKDADAKVLLTDRDPGALRELFDTVVMIPDEYEALLEAADEAELGVDVTEDTLAGLFYTGGTTGAAKGVMLSHRNLIANSFHWMTVSPPTQDNVTLIMAPLFHAAGSNGVLSGIWSGSCQIPLAVFNPAVALDLIGEHKVTQTLGVPAMLAAISELQHTEPRDTSSLQMIAHGGSPIATEVVRRACEAFPTAEFLHVYGLTETSPLLTGLRDEQTLLDVDRGRSCGQSIIGVQVKIIDQGGNEMPSGEVGELVAKGPNIMKGYWRKPEQTKEVIQDGWFRSGDMGYMDDEGYVFLVDRAKDMIVSGGENVYCSEVEEALYKHPAVLEAAVFGIPDDEWGEAVHAVVVPREEIAPEELIDFCRKHIAGYKLPKAITFSDMELPKSGPGKVLKRELRAPFWEGHDRRVN
ncbi:MAG: long-chain-fatty-acid--CoA ligase [Gammaproteobacteria bacterium]|nr:long-chain-fatty-acid--CoA ligase [Gammaproteobacteria bacterium]